MYSKLVLKMMILKNNIREHKI